MSVCFPHMASDCKKTKHVIGLCGAPGAGKSTVAGILRDLGCLVLDADAMAQIALEMPDVKRQLLQRWGTESFLPDGKPDRLWLGKKIFAEPGERFWLESLIHPLVRASRNQARCQAFARKDVVAIVEDCPLLFEKGLDAQCDATLFVDAPLAARQNRVAATRNWSPQELAFREKAQWPLDTKRARSDYVLVNDAGFDGLRQQAVQALGLILAGPLSPRNG